MTDSSVLGPDSPNLIPRDGRRLPHLAPDFGAPTPRSGASSSGLVQESLAPAALSGAGASMVTDTAPVRSTEERPTSTS